MSRVKPGTQPAALVACRESTVAGGMVEDRILKVSNGCMRYGTNAVIIAGAKQLPEMAESDA